MKRLIAASTALLSFSAYAENLRLERIVVELPPAGVSAMTLPEVNVTIEGEQVVYKPKIKGDIEISPARTSIAIDRSFDSMESMKSHALHLGCDPATWGPAQRRFRAYMTEALNDRQDYYGTGTGEVSINIELSGLPQVPRISGIRIEYYVSGAFQSARLFCIPKFSGTARALVLRRHAS